MNTKIDSSSEAVNWTLNLHMLETEKNKSVRLSENGIVKNDNAP